MTHQNLTCLKKRRDAIDKQIRRELAGIIVVALKMLGWSAQNGWLRYVLSTLP